MTTPKTTFMRGDVVQIDWGFLEPSNWALIVGYDNFEGKLRIVLPGGSDYYRSYTVNPDEIRLVKDADRLANPKFTEAFVAEALENSARWKSLQQQRPSDESSVAMVRGAILVSPLLMTGDDHD
jgi:hypothetical protein